MKDKDFYGSGKHPEGGSPMVKINGQWYSQVDIDYIKSQSNSERTLNKIESKTVNHTGFSKSRAINDNKKSEREQQLDRLAILQNVEARLVKDLERTRSVINSIERNLSI